ncbi:MAG: cytochrome c maturation protein CcmE [Bacteroidota bacterium]
MKISHIIGLVIIAVAIGVIISMSGDASTYVTFGEAQTMVEKGNSGKVHVVGSLKKDASGHTVGLSYNPSEDPNLFTFQLTDDRNTERTVVYHNPKPQDFERSEKIVVIGCMKEGTFVADKILLKCPSKYQESRPDLQKPAKTQASV